MEAKRTTTNPILAVQKSLEAMSSQYPGLDVANMLAAQGRAISALFTANQKFIESVQQLWTYQLKAAGTVADHVYQSSPLIFMGRGYADTTGSREKGPQLITETAVEAMRDASEIMSKCCVEMLSAFGEQLTAAAAMGMTSKTEKGGKKAAA